MTKPRKEKSSAKNLTSKTSKPFPDRLPVIEKDGYVIVQLPNDVIGFMDEAPVADFDAILEELESRKKGNNAADVVIAVLEKRRDGFNAKSKKAKKIDAAIKQVKKAFDSADAAAALDKSPNYWADAFTPKPGLPAAVAPLEIKRGARARPPLDLSPSAARDYYVWVDPFAAEKETAETPETPAAKAVPPLFTPSAKTKRTVVFLVDGSGNMLQAQANGQTILNNILAAVQKVERGVLRKDPTSPAYEIALFGGLARAPTLLDRTSTRDGGLDSGGYFSPAIKAIRQLAEKNPSHMLHVVVLGDGDLLDGEASTAAIKDLMAACPRVSFDFVQVEAQQPKGRTVMESMASALSNQTNRIRMARASRADSNQLITERIADVVLPRLSTGLPAAKPAAKKSPSV